MPRWLLTILALLLTTGSVRPEIITKAVEYRHADKILEGCLIHDAAARARGPAILLAHESGGNTAAARLRAAQWARLGYPVFAVDLYGKGITPRDSKDALARLLPNSRDRKPLRDRLEAGLAVLCRQPQVDPKRVAGIGYGAGGTALLELARAGADLEGVVCLHGDLGTPTPGDAKKISAQVLVLLGSDDPFIPLAQMTAFEDEMRQGGVDWRVVRFGGVGHDFTNPQAGRNLKSGSAYDADAEKRANELIKSFLAEVVPLQTQTVRAASRTDPPPPKGVPDKALNVLKHVDKEGMAPPGYEGGRTFLNVEKVLPQTDSQGRRLKYREWDVNPLKAGVNRGPERLVTGSDGSAYYTDDHYKSFKKIR